LRLGDVAQALPLLEQTLRSKPENGLVHWQLGQALQGMAQYAQAIACYDRAQALGVNDPQLAVQRYEAAGLAFKHNGNWLHYDRIQRLVRQNVMCTDCWVVGESTLASPLFSNTALRRATENHARNVLASIGPTPPFDHQVAGGKIRLGFVGCDFFEQATAYLMVGFVEALDRQCFDVIAYDHGGERQDTSFRRRIVAAYDDLVDISALSDAEAAQRIHADRIDILFSIKNPASARLGIFARRPAPIQVHYLYYPGTSGMPFFDYIVADDVVIPAGAESGYTEKVLRLPGCYQPNDSGRVLARDTSRQQWGLPDNAVILANFSQTYKFTPSVYDLWCQLLQRDPHRILWLLCEVAEEQVLLRREAQDRGIAPERIHFTRKLVTQEHLDRLRHADLTLDTFPYGGHTLTSDALWAGTPVITLCGETFASRVAASLLTDVGMCKLVAHTEQEYLDKAERLLSSQDARQHWRQHLDSGRPHFALFNATTYAWRFGQVMQELLSRERLEDTSSG
jgi:predicted O-linked N-acetylglucosamine transferase (SPINDLY family)